MIDKILQLGRIKKQIIMFLFDSIAIILVLLCSFSIRLGYWFWPEIELLFIILMAPIIAIPVFFSFGLHLELIRFFGIKSLWTTTKAVSLYALIWGIVGFMYSVPWLPRSVILINWILAIIVIAGARLLARWLFSKTGDYYEDNKSSIIIYGAGAAGRQLSDALAQSKEHKTVAFIDDEIKIQKHLINGVKVYGIASIESIIKKYKVNEVLIAIPSASSKKRNEIINLLESYPVMVRILPGVSEIAQGKVKVNDLREIIIDDLLGRDIVNPNQELLGKNIRNKVVMVTGAGGSIGSELCRQIVKLGSSKLILFEHSELALYSINKELSKTKVKAIILPILGSVSNQKILEYICQKFSVQTIYHAAAYKHVPMVEFNNTEGTKNNVFGTLSCAQAAINSKVETFVLISTDKAVRPTNTMGASKRIAELILQSLSKEKHSTNFCMVRFGNVLGSSGSVIPLFKDQIAQGGPITVTDINVIRYFMTIPESVELVIQAGAMANENYGDVFVLNMGEPININDLAYRMVHLSGLEVKDSENPDGDIEIKYTGLRPGEKLYEELMLGDNVFDTGNPMIMRAQEDMINWKELKPALDDLKRATSDFDNKKTRELLTKIVPAFKPQSDAIGILYN